ncbi:hypothetical protein VTN00DRAFT_3664 [Thermoascus crustaceus]|uniref:uncharacterized protein n=1 Tax=Thermoascus crustaceus TaxID=5088 RepID=UPI003741F084
MAAQLRALLEIGRSEVGDEDGSRVGVAPNEPREQVIDTAQTQPVRYLLQFDLIFPAIMMHMVWHSSRSVPSICNVLWNSIEDSLPMEFTDFLYITTTDDF